MTYLDLNAPRIASPTRLARHRAGPDRRAAHTRGIDLLTMILGVLAVRRRLFAVGPIIRPFGQADLKPAERRYY